MNRSLHEPRSPIFNSRSRIVGGKRKEKRDWFFTFRFTRSKGDLTNSLEISTFLRRSVRDRLRVDRTAYVRALSLSSSTSHAMRSTERTSRHSSSMISRLIASERREMFPGDSPSLRWAFPVREKVTGNGGRLSVWLRTLTRLTGFIARRRRQRRREWENRRGNAEERRAPSGSTDFNQDMAWQQPTADQASQGLSIF